MYKVDYSIGPTSDENIKLSDRSQLPSFELTNDLCIYPIIGENVELSTIKQSVRIESVNGVSICSTVDENIDIYTFSQNVSIESIPDVSIRNTADEEVIAYTISKSTSELSLHSIVDSEPQTNTSTNNGLPSDEFTTNLSMCAINVGGFIQKLIMVILICAAGFCVSETKTNQYDFCDTLSDYYRVFISIYHYHNWW